MNCVKNPWKGWIRSISSILRIKSIKQLVMMCLYKVSKGNFVFVLPWTYQTLCPTLKCWTRPIAELTGGEMAYQEFVKVACYLYAINAYAYIMLTCYLCIWLVTWLTVLPLHFFLLVLYTFIFPPFVSIVLKPNMCCICNIFPELKALLGGNACTFGWCADEKVFKRLCFLRGTHTHTHTSLQ